MKEVTYEILICRCIGNVDDAVQKDLGGNVVKKNCLFPYKIKTIAYTYINNYITSVYLLNYSKTKKSMPVICGSIPSRKYLLKMKRDSTLKTGDLVIMIGK